MSSLKLQTYFNSSHVVGTPDFEKHRLFKKMLKSYENLASAEVFVDHIKSNLKFKFGIRFLGSEPEFVMCNFNKEPSLIGEKIRHFAIEQYTIVMKAPKENKVSANGMCELTTTEVIPNILYKFDLETEEDKYLLLITPEDYSTFLELFDLQD